MKLGLTTNIYAVPLKSKEVEIEDILESAKSFGLKAMEIRDDSASLEEDRISKLRSRADDIGLALSYAIKNSILPEGDRALFKRAVKLASLCSEQCILRILAAQDLLKIEGRLGYTLNEIEQIAKILDEYGSIASDIFIAVEHAREPLYGDGKTYFGISDLIKKVSSRNIGLTFDPANSTNRSLCRVPSSEDEVLKFVDEFAERIFLFHYKTTREGRVQPSIGDADIDNQILLERLSRVYDGIVCIEIPGSTSLEETNRNLQASIAYLEEKNLMKFFQ